jgi:hypothetical protein
MGEVATVSASGQNPVTSTSYNVAGQLTAITYGSGDVDAFAYHATTGLMKSYAFDINGQTETGTLNWNADGTLGLTCSPGTARGWI